MRLETTRLVIRPCSHDEADRLLDIQSRLEVVMWLGDGEPVLMKGLDEAHACIDRYHERSVAGSVILLTLPDAQDGEVEVGWQASQAVCRRLGLDDLGVMEKLYEGEPRVYRTTPEHWATRA